MIIIIPDVCNKILYVRILIYHLKSSKYYDEPIDAVWSSCTSSQQRVNHFKGSGTHTIRHIVYMFKGTSAIKGKGMFTRWYCYLYEGMNGGYSEGEVEVKTLCTQLIFGFVYKYVKIFIFKCI